MVGSTRGLVTADPVTVARLRAQLLSGPPAERVDDVVHRLLAVQAQDPRGARLAVRARSRGLQAEDVDRALTERRSLVVTWLNRGTLHLVTADDYWWLHPLATPSLEAGNRRRLGQEGVSERDAARGVELIADTLSAHGAQTRVELRDRLHRAGVPTAGQALYHLFLAASLRGVLVRGPVLDGDHAFVAPRDWLGPPPSPIDRPGALARLARRYLAGHGPSDARDLAKWVGLPLRDARAGLTAIEGDLVHHPDGLVDIAPGTPPAVDLPPPRLLGPFDPLLLGWTSRDRFVGRHRGLVTTNGLFRPFALVDGRAVATWSLTAERIRIQLLDPVDPPALDALTTDAADVRRFLGLPTAKDRHGEPEILPPRPTRRRRAAD